MARHKLGLEIAKQLKADKRSQAWLADELGVSRSAVTKWLTEDGNRISVDDLLSIADKLRVDKIEFFELAKKVWPNYAFEYDEQLGKFSQSEIRKKPKPIIEIPKLPKVINKTCPIYFQLNLGKEKPREVNEQRENLVFEFPYIMHTENDDKWRKVFTKTPAHELLKTWSQTVGIHPIIGEPGGGKSTLLGTWAHLLKEMSTSTKQYVPLFVPLREVDTSCIEGYFKKKNFDVLPYLNSDYDKTVQPVWLFDGLDELPKDYKEDWLDEIAKRNSQPCLLTCRTALWDSYYEKMFSEAHYLLGINQQEQKKFLQALGDEWRSNRLRGFEEADETWVDELHSELQKQSNLRQISGSPLLLTLIARTNKPNAIALPAKRVDFYRKAFKELLEQRDGTEKSIFTFITPLSKLAHEVSKDELTAEFSEMLYEKHTAELIKDDRTTLKNSNILKFSDDYNCQWLHQTFQEWLFAEFLHKDKEYGLLEATKQYWKDPNYHEVIALLWGLSSQIEQTRTAEYLVEEGCKVCNKNARRGRSGLKTLFNLIRRSGEDKNIEVNKILLNNTKTSLYRREAVATSDVTPEILFAELAKDDNGDVRANVAENANTAPETLANLAKDSNPYVLMEVSKNVNSTQEILRQIDKDDEYFRTLLLGTSSLSLSPETEALLVAHTLDTTSEDSYDTKALVALAKEYWELVRLDVDIAANQNTSPKTLSKLAQDKDIEISTLVAKNLNLLPAVLESLAKDKSAIVQLRVAENMNTLPKTLEKLARNDDRAIRKGVAKNPNSCFEWF